MLWNWTTRNACFLTHSWHITSAGMFAGSLLGIIALVITLEGVRRFASEYDGFLRRKYAIDDASASFRTSLSANTTTAAAANSGSQQQDEDDGHLGSDEKGRTTTERRIGSSEKLLGGSTTRVEVRGRFRPGVVEQAVRALLHTLQVVLAYLVMLLAMSYNGYVLICIFIGAFVGFFVFQWRPVRLEEGVPESVLCHG
ncbi:Ctr copper transporter [Viridothelium virens]|uniref:Copper transport protein n=1 Tax=Viridothelium virens TaxID=1048519 RepID=A0A6A6GU18_VIRVR|nr:Ctr copper transporter [Viridothelium virens]